MNADYKDLPDFCNQDVVFSSMIMAEIVALMLSIVQPGSYMDKLEYLAIASMVIQWILMIDLILLCKLKHFLQKMATVPFYLTIFLLLQVVTFIVSSGSDRILHYLQLDASFQGEWKTAFLMQNMALSVLFSIIIIHYAFLNARWKKQLVLQSQSRINALQARIRPHFLFNSLNTIAALIHIDPERADKAILDLSEIFRASMNQQTLISLEQELQIVKKYLQIEKLRLDKRLQVDWQIQLKDKSIPVPALMIQPLVENAVYHGIEQLPQGGCIQIQIKESEESIKIAIQNPLEKKSANSAGNRLALKNICERLKLIYQKNADINIEQNEQFYRVTLSLPKNAIPDR